MSELPRPFTITPDAAQRFTRLAEEQHVGRLELRDRDHPVLRHGDPDRRIDRHEIVFVSIDPQLLHDVVCDTAVCGFARVRLCIGATGCQKAAD